MIRQKKFGRQFTDYIKYRGVKIPFSFELALKRGLFISGGKGSGKTNLMKIFVNEIMGKTFPSNRIVTKGEDRTVVIKVVDPSQAWYGSSLPYYQVVTSIRDIVDGKVDNPLGTDMLYDTSRLKPYDQKLFIAELLGSTFDYIVDNIVPIWIYFVLEESQMIFPSGSLRALWAQEGLRAITVGRNYDEGVGSLTQFPATVSTNLVKACGLSYFGVAWEENDIRKLQRYVKWKRPRCDAVFPNLDVGQFVYLRIGKGSRAIQINTPEFKPKTTPQLWKPKTKSTSIIRKLFKGRSLL